ncbi:MAG TPA: LacI family DNA-binding transcriptional regulator [Luteolibacter sp.]|nr:LacI family DNA-binding transcriptional regulator [Luteolibacter sp.]
MSGSPIVTMRDVARAAGVAVSTVSKALRNDPSIPESRCRSIRQMAERMGYRPNPMVATLMARMHHHRRRSDPHHLAWLDFWADEPRRRETVNLERILAGARLRAEELGYGVEVYQAGTDARSLERLKRTLSTRGQWGVMVPPVPESAAKLALDLRGLSAVTIGTSLHEPWHRVSPNHFQGAVLAFERLVQLGFKRPGLVLSPEMHERVNGRWLGAFMACRQRLPETDRVEPLLVDPRDSKTLERWWKSARPDAVLVAESLDWPMHQGPELAWLMLGGEPRDLGGMDYQLEELGRVAVEVVVAQIHRNERGTPQVPQTVLIDGVWSGR